MGRSGQEARRGDGGLIRAPSAQSLFRQPAGAVFRACPMKSSSHDDLREPREGSSRQDRRRHDGLQGRAHRDEGRHRGGHRLAAQEGPVEGGQEGRARRRRGPDRHRCQGQERRRGRGQLRDRLRGAQRAVPGHGAENRLARGQGQGRCGKAARHDLPGQEGDGRGDRQGDGRHHRREHERAPDRRARGAGRRRRLLRAQPGDGGPRQDRRARRARVRAARTPPSWRASAA